MLAAFFKPQEATIQQGFARTAGESRVQGSGLMIG
jgi:hypothetical protein